MDIVALVGGGSDSISSQHHFTWSRRDSVEQSRHRTDYDSLAELGSGGFGKVFQVRNKVDFKIYALKIVKIQGGNDYSTTVLREVQVLSSIPSNDHVVRYYSAWVEKGEAFENDYDENTNCRDCYSSWSSSESSERSRSSDAADYSKRNSSKRNRATYTKDPTCNLCHSSYEDWEVSLEYWGLIDSVLQPLDLCIDCYQKNIPVDVDKSKMTVRPSTSTRVLPDCLYILMEYCETTLLQAVEKIFQNNDISEKNKIIWSYFQQTVEGLAQLHANGIMHRDVKPNNIFVHQGVVKIGDLGLATTQKTTSASSHTSKDNGNKAPSETSSSWSSEVGTYLYQAPEVKTGQYNEKCDVYSLGVLLVEIFSNFTTGMERALVLGKLKSTGIIPEALFATSTSSDRSPKQTRRLAHHLLAKDPSDRPSCGEILIMLPDNRDLDCEYKNTMFSLLKIEKLQEDLRNKDREIARLQKILEKNDISY